MRDISKLREHRSISIEEQQREANQDTTGKIKRYLALAEKLFRGDEDSTEDN